MIEFADAYVAAVTVLRPRWPEDVTRTAESVSQWTTNRCAVVWNRRLYRTRHARNDPGVGCSCRPESNKSKNGQYSTGNGAPRLRRPVIWYVLNQMRYHEYIIKRHRYDEKGIGEEEERGITPQHYLSLA
mmetsp:Transcript_27843/g.65370  ORF Transcript_27843/g.65370 Transcript_27843/m.65370 type:complete len:130 (+) Transcript_27843:723-1112(+)